MVAVQGAPPSRSIRFYLSLYCRTSRLPHPRARCLAPGNNSVKFPSSSSPHDRIRLRFSPSFPLYSTCAQHTCISSPSPGLVQAGNHRSSLTFTCSRLQFPTPFMISPCAIPDSRDRGLLFSFPSFLNSRPWTNLQLYSGTTPKSFLTSLSKWKFPSVAGFALGPCGPEERRRGSEHG